MIVIYTPEVTNRIIYTLDFVFHQYYGIAYELTQDADYSVKENELLINYSKIGIPGSLSVFSFGLLTEKNIQVQPITVSQENEYGIFFQTAEKYDVNFDIFSCVFYLLSRYEEYLPHQKDEHGRYLSSNSILSSPIFNFEPVIEIWLSAFKNTLLQHLPTLIFNNYQFEVQATFDIDNAFKYLGRNWFKKPPNIFKIQTWKVLLKLEKDPYDTFDFLLNQLKKLKSPPHFFFLLNDNGKLNSNSNPKSKVLQSKLNEIIHSNFKKNIGIHFSYEALENNSLNKEIKMLNAISENTIHSSRQHFLRINFPKYFRALSDAGIQIDYSLAYPDIIGFRAGYSRQFLFFDVVKNETSKLQIQPSCFMDATLEYYRNKNIEKNKKETLDFLNKIMKINSKLVAIFHNDLFVNDFYVGLFNDILQLEKKGYEK